MIDQPPERNRQSGSPLRRLETNIGFALALILTSLWLLGDKSSRYAGVEIQGLLAGSSAVDNPAIGWYAILAIVGVVLVNGLFVAAETAIEILRPIHVKHVREANQGQSDRLQDLYDNKQQYIAASTLGSHIARVGMVLVGLVLAPGVSVWLSHQFNREPDFAMLMLAAVIVALPIAMFNLILELVPKSYAALHPHRVALALYRFVRITSILLKIPTAAVSGLANLVTQRFGAKATFSINNQAEEEIKNLVDSAQESGEIDVDEKELLHSVFEFTDTVAREVMTPRVDLDAMPVNSDPNEIIQVIRESGRSRIPLYEETDDQIVGIIHAKDLLMAMLHSTEPVNVRSLMRPALFVPENKSVSELLQELRMTRSEMAVVQDEFGGTAGVVTTEDIVEELVGDIVDEYDVEEPDFLEVDGGFSVGGKMHVDDVNEAIGSDFSSEEFDTIGGFVFGLFERQPKPGESMDTQGYRFIVEDTDGRRILRLRIEKIPERSEAELLEQHVD